MRNSSARPLTFALWRLLLDLCTNKRCRNDLCIPSSSGFTAINSSPSLSSPCQPSTEFQEEQNESEASQPGRKRNPMVASYLGLGSPAEPLLFANHAPRSDVHTPARKRRGTRTGDKASTKKKATKASNHTASYKDSYVDTGPNPSNTKQEKYGRALLPTPIPTVQSSVAAPLSEPRETSPKEFSENESSLKPPYTQVTVAANEDDHDDDFGQLCFDFEPQTSADNVSPSQNQSTKLRC